MAFRRTGTSISATTGPSPPKKERLTDWFILGAYESSWNCVLRDRSNSSSTVNKAFAYVRELCRDNPSLTYLLCKLLQPRSWFAKLLGSWSHLYFSANGHPPAPALGINPQLSCGISETRTRGQLELLKTSGEAQLPSKAPPWAGWPNGKLP